MCQIKHAGKQIKLLPLRPKTGQPQQTSTLALPLTPPLIAIVPSLSPTNHAYHVRKSLPPLLRTPSHYKAFDLHLHLHYIKVCTNYTERSVMKINGAM